MSQRLNSNGTGRRERQHDDNAVDSSRSVLELAYPIVDPAMLLKRNGAVVADGPHIVLTCGPHDDDEEE